MRKTFDEPEHPAKLCRDMTNEELPFALQPFPDRDEKDHGTRIDRFDAAKVQNDRLYSFEFRLQSMELSFDPVEKIDLPAARKKECGPILPGRNMNVCFISHEKYSIEDWINRAVITIWTKRVRSNDKCQAAETLI